MGKLMMPSKIAEQVVVPEGRVVFAIRLSRRGSLCRRGEERRGSGGLCREGLASGGRTTRACGIK